MNNGYQKYFKRWLDFCAAILISIIFLFPIGLIFLSYFLDLKGSPFFTQERIGIHNRPFLLYKFRTLTHDTHKSLLERRFPLGNLLRFTNLDELPQLFNILRGDLSFVGPRPLPTEYLPLYSKEQLRRHEVRPGITGWAQVNGRHSIPWKDKFALDLYYVQNISFRLDMTILFKTILLILAFRKDQSLLEKKFTGNNDA